MMSPPFKPTPVAFAARMFIVQRQAELLRHREQQTRTQGTQTSATTTASTHEPRVESLR